MKEIVYSEDRLLGANLIMENNGFRYAVEYKWIKWPDDKEIHSVMDVACDADGHVYLGMEDNSCPIMVFKEDGTFARIIGEGIVDKGHGLSVTPQNTLLCADTGYYAHTIREFTLDGQLLRTFGTPGVPSDTGYNGIAARDARNATKADPLRKNDKTYLYNALDSIVRRGKPFNRPTHMIKTENGEYFATDGYGNCAVHKFRADGEYEFSWGAPGHALGEFYLPHGICQDLEGRLWVADRENKRVQIFDQKGKIMAVLNGFPNKVHCLSFDGTYMYIGELGGFSIVDMKFNLVARFGDGGKFMRTHGIWVDDHKNLYICSHKSGYGGENCIRLRRLSE